MGRGRVGSPPHAAGEAQDAQEHERLGIVELVLAEIAAELVRLAQLEVERQEGVQEERHGSQIDHRMQRIARGDVGERRRREQDDPGEEGGELEVKRQGDPLHAAADRARGATMLVRRMLAKDAALTSSFGPKRVSIDASQCCNTATRLISSNGLIGAFAGTLRSSTRVLLSKRLPSLPSGSMLMQSKTHLFQWSLHHLRILVHVLHELDDKFKQNI